MRTMHWTTRRKVGCLRSCAPTTVADPRTISDREYVFPDDEGESTATSFKFLQMAHAWKKSQQTSGAGAPPATVRETADDKDSDVASSNESD